MNTKDHWQTAYSAKDSTRLSWYQERPERSLALLREAQLSHDCPIIDVGGGASILVDCLLQEGYLDLTVLDIASVSLQRARRRLGVRADSVHWLEQDIISFIPQRQYGLWHDRAMFHFLTGAQHRRIYIDVMRSALRAGGQLIISTFALSGPKKCSGLEVVQYNAARLSRELGEEFHLQQEEGEDHITPAGDVQQFTFYRFVRR
jgi:hypothetical protein